MPQFLSEDGWATVSSSGTTPDADATTKGVIQLAGDLSGTAASPQIAAGAIVNADVSASAAIAYGKLALSGSIVNADVATSAAIAYSKLNLTGSVVNADISATAAIAYSKLSLTGSIVNADVSGTAAIAYSKLSLSGSIVNADIATGAAIALSKLATDPLARANHTGTQTASTISDFNTAVRTNRLDQMAAPTASVSMGSQKITNLATPTTGSSEAATAAYVDGVVAAGAPDATTTAKGLVQLAGDLAGTATSPQIATGAIVNADVNSSAAIALSKLASGTSAQIIVGNASGVPTYVALSGDATISNAGALTTNKVSGWTAQNGTSTSPVPASKGTINDICWGTGSVSLTSAAAGSTTIDINWGNNTPSIVVANITQQSNYAVMCDTYTNTGTKGRFTARVKHIDNTSQTATVNFNFIAIY